ncbi:hypothetical protein E1287_42320 [Actinomadura sp. KC06]|nr:hypothetical protein E1287_42320 [Actinomadura sp. KC06]
METEWAPPPSQPHAQPQAQPPSQGPHPGLPPQTPPPWEQPQQYANWQQPPPPSLRGAGPAGRAERRKTLVVVTVAVVLVVAAILVGAFILRGKLRTGAEAPAAAPPSPVIRVQAAVLGAR